MPAWVGSGPRPRRYRALPMGPLQGLLRPVAALAVAAGIAGPAVGCGGGENPIEVKVRGDDRGNVLGFPVLATKNTTRVAGEDPVQNAAAVATAVYPAVDGRQPQAVTLVDQEDWA
jgi:hypothetical protein